MKRWIKWGIGLLVVNLIIDLIVRFSIVTIIYGGDFIQVSVPLLIAVVVILPQPWFALLGYLNDAWFVAALETTFISLGVYGSLAYMGYLNWLNAFWSRVRVRHLIVVTLGLCLLTGTTFYLRYIDFPCLNWGQPEPFEYTKWKPSSPLTDNRYYCLGGLLDRDWLWRAKIVPDDIHTLVSHFGLKPIELSQVRSDFFDMPPYWWNPTPTLGVQAYATPDFPSTGRGQDGTHYLVLWDVGTNILHMWIKENF